MIRDASALREIQQSWNGVEILRERLKVSAFASMSDFGGMFPTLLANAAHNLPFLHACAVLNDVLEQLRDEGHFDCRYRFLGTLVMASRDKISWRDYALINDKVVKRRNGVAHHAELLDRGDCWKYVDAKKDELRGWGVIEVSDHGAAADDPVTP